MAQAHEPCWVLIMPVKMLVQAKQWLRKVQTCEGYAIIEEKGCLVLGWKSKPINPLLQLLAGNAPK